MSLKRNIKHRVELGEFTPEKFNEAVVFCRDILGKRGKKDGWRYRRQFVSGSSFYYQKLETLTFFFKDEEDVLAFKLSKGIL